MCNKIKWHKRSTLLLLNCYIKNISKVEILNNWNVSFSIFNKACILRHLLHRGCVAKGVCFNCLLDMILWGLRLIFEHANSEIQPALEGRIWFKTSKVLSIVYIRHESPLKKNQIDRFLSCILNLHQLVCLFSILRKYISWRSFSKF